MSSKSKPSGAGGLARARAPMPPAGAPPASAGERGEPKASSQQESGGLRRTRQAAAGYPPKAPTTGPRARTYRGPVGPTSESTPAAGTVGAALEKLLAQTADRVRRGIRAAATLQMQRWHAGWLAEQLGGGLPLASINHRLVVEHVERWAAAGNLAPHTISKRLSTLRRALRLAVAREELPAMPIFPEVASPPWRPRVRILRTFDEYRSLMAALPLERADFVAVSLWTCQRPGDVRRMTWGDVDLVGDPPTMRIRSTKTRRPVPIRVKMPLPLVSVLTARRNRLTSRTGFAPAPGDPLVDDWPAVSSRLPVVAARIGLPPLSAMDLRHTGISWMVRRTGLTVAAQSWGGWSNFTMMELHYAHALPARLVDAADELASIADEARVAEVPPS